VILETTLDEAWATLSTLAPARGTLAGHTGTAVLEEADDDTHTARLRLQGVGPNGPVTATVTATLEPVTAGTRLHLATRAFPDPPHADDIQLIANTIAAWLARRVEPPVPRGRWVPASFFRRHR
jgi:hypothetical protein